jgi:16S rRNA (cytosine1402-N4)-methyltransferase
MHEPVLAREAIEALAVRPDGIYVDGTFGRGGHSRLILERLGPAGRLIALDRDPQAAEAARAIGDARFSFFKAKFSELEMVPSGVQGMLFDLGVSSPQLDDPARGFSFRHDGPLDMRMDPEAGMSAAEWLAKAQEQEIRGVIRDYGENGLLNRLQRRLLLRAAASPSSAPGNWPISWLARSAPGSRARIRRRAPFRLYGFTSIGSLRKYR